MIKIEIKKDLIKISGHAGYDDYGKDIVCASVSSIIYTTVNGILNIKENAIKFTDNDTMLIEVISNDEITKKLLDNMINLLTDLSIQYPENLKISKGE